LVWGGIAYDKNPGFALACVCVAAGSGRGHRQNGGGPERQD
jgi:hypothetical protein